VTNQANWPPASTLHDIAWTSSSTCRLIC